MQAPLPACDPPAPAALRRVWVRPLSSLAGSRHVNSFAPLNSHAVQACPPIALCMPKRLPVHPHPV